jgi:hypothetical protein
LRKIANGDIRDGVQPACSKRNLRPLVRLMARPYAAAAELDFSGINRVAALVLNGTSQPDGLYNAGNQSAYLAGTGSLLVGAAATNPTNIITSVTGHTLSLSWPLTWGGFCNPIAWA